MHHNNQKACERMDATALTPLGRFVSQYHPESLDRKKSHEWGYDIGCELSLVTMSPVTQRGSTDGAS